MGFEQTTFGEYAKIQGGNAYKSKDFIEISANKVLKIKNVRFGTVNYNDSGYISDELAQATKAWKVREGDILISMTGSGPNAPQSLVGRVARVWKGEPSAWINQRVGRIQLKNEGSIHPDFLFYLLSLQQSQDFLVSNSSGSANQANISGKIIELLPCPKVSYKQSAQIAEIARSLDEKIILNNQTNQTLEKMAQTLFKSWFVDFEPVFDNALAKADFNLDNLPSAWPAALVQRATSRLQVLQDNPTLQAKLTQHNQVTTENNTAPTQASQAENTHQHFPNDFEPSNEPSIGINGWIPKGWKEGKLSSVVKFSTDRIDDTKLTLDNYISTDNMLPNKAGVIQASKLPSIKTTPAFDEGHILISNIRPYFKKIWFATSSGGRSNDVLGFIALDKQCNEYVLNLLFQDVFFDYMLATSKGSKMPRGDKTAIMDWNIVIPPNVIQKHYSNFVKDFYQANTIRTNEIGVLTKLRDTLLPKLISGELPIPDSLHIAENNH